MEKYEVMGDFVILFPLDKGEDAYKKIDELQNAIKIALKNGHIKVMGINIRIIQN